MNESNTLGQRIQEGRKAAGLSQEALGERLNVSRQAVSKWEADAAIPELENLIAMSRIFGVSVGQLLGVETGTESAPAEEASGELTETQLRMVQEITDRYLAAQPEKKKSPWGKWDVRILFALCGVMLALLAGLHSKVKEIDAQYGELRNSVYNVESSVNQQINSLTGQMSNILDENTNILHSSQIAVTDFDPAAQTVTLRVSAVPKEWTDSTTATFTATLSDARQLTVEAAGENGTFVAEDFVVPMDPTIQLSMTLTDGGSARTGSIETLHDCLPGCFQLTANVFWGASWSATGKRVVLEGLSLSIYSPGSPVELAPVAVDLCLYRNRETEPEQVIPVEEAVPLFQETGYVEMNHFTGYQTTIDFSGGDTVMVTVRMTDNHGQTTWTPISAFRSTGGKIEALDIYPDDSWKPGDMVG